MDKLLSMLRTLDYRNTVIPGQNVSPGAGAATAANGGPAVQKIPPLSKQISNLR